jgi:hypothetical protein
MHGRKLEVYPSALRICPEHPRDLVMLSASSNQLSATVLEGTAGHLSSTFVNFFHSKLFPCVWLPIDY